MVPLTSRGSLCWLRQPALEAAAVLALPCPRWLPRYASPTHLEVTCKHAHASCPCCPHCNRTAFSQHGGNATQSTANTKDAAGRVTNQPLASTPRPSPPQPRQLRAQHQTGEPTAPRSAQVPSCPGPWSRWVARNSPAAHGRDRHVWWQQNTPPHPHVLLPHLHHRPRRQDSA